MLNVLSFDKFYYGLSVIWLYVVSWCCVWCCYWYCYFGDINV